MVVYMIYIYIYISYIIYTTTTTTMHFFCCNERIRHNTVSQHYISPILFHRLQPAQIRPAATRQIELKSKRNEPSAHLIGLPACLSVSALIVFHWVAWWHNLPLLPLLLLLTAFKSSDWQSEISSLHGFTCLTMCSLIATTITKLNACYYMNHGPFWLQWHLSNLCFLSFTPKKIKTKKKKKKHCTTTGQAES